MKNCISIILLLTLATTSYAQSIDFDVVIVDTARHFNPSPYTKSGFDSDMIIDNDSIFQVVFRWSTSSVSSPRFKESTWLKRTISLGCLSKVEHRVSLDSVRQTVTWKTLVSGDQSCLSTGVRHVVIAIPKPPAQYKILFETEYVKTNAGAARTEVTARELKISPVLFESLETIKSATRQRYRIIIDNDRLYSTGKELGLKTDFSKNLILANTYGGDCRLRLQPHAYYDPVTNALVLTVYNIWGGCRAGGREFLALAVEKPGDEFQVVFQEIQVDSLSEYEEHIQRLNR